jgi:ATP-dependent Clp protease ATP-binding subunit ClpC
MTATDEWLDVTEAARAGKLDPVVGRERELDRIVRVLLRRTRNNPLLVGRPGVGKTALVEALAQRIADGAVPEPLRGTRICAFDLGLIVAEARARGDARPLEAHFAEALARRRPDGAARGRLGTVLFLDELHLLAAGAAEGAAGMVALLRLALADRSLALITETTPEEHARYRGAAAGLDGLFQPIEVAEPSVEETVAILRAVGPRYAQFHGVAHEDGALRAAASLAAERFAAARALPDPAIDLLDEATAHARTGGRAIVTAADVAAVAGLWCAA